MRRSRYRLRKSKYYSIVFSTACAAVLIIFLILLFAYARSKTDIPDIAVSILLTLALCGGGMLSGYLHGRAKRRRGLANGAKCGAILYTLLFLTGIFYLGAFPPLALFRYLPLLCASGATGGAVGVNSVLKNPPFTSD